MLMSGFTDPVIGAQSTFRSVMDAFAHPGRIVALTTQTEGPPPLLQGTAAIALTLFDHDTPVWIDTPDVVEAANWLRFHTTAPVVTDPGNCLFAIVTDSRRLLPFDRFDLGCDDYPDRSATIIVQVDSLNLGPVIRLAGPGIQIHESIAPEPLPLDMPERLAANRSLFPRGVDLLFVSGSGVVALPRSVRAIGDS